jgi:hypothetical protein
MTIDGLPPVRLCRPVKITIKLCACTLAVRSSLTAAVDDACQVAACGRQRMVGDLPAGRVQELGLDHVRQLGVPGGASQHVVRRCGRVCRGTCRLSRRAGRRGVQHMTQLRAAWLCCCVLQ